MPGDTRTERIDIITQEKGSRVVKRNIQGIGVAAAGSAQSVDFLKKALALIGGAAVIRKLIQIADTFTNIQNRLKLVTTGTENLAMVTEELLQISNRTRSSFESNAEVFNRFALATKELGVSQRDLLQITESINQAVILSGASAIEAQAGLIQLSQGLASGALRGDELRSVLEQLPVIADVISKRLGVTRGQLRELGSQGKITAEVVIEAFKDAREELEENFAKTTPTVSQAFQVLSNQTIAFLGRLDQSLGATRALSDFLILLSDNIDRVARALGTAGFIGAVAGAIRAVNAFTAAIAANPVGALLTALTAGISLLAAFSDEIIVGSDGVTTLADVSLVLLEVFKELGGTVLDKLRDGFDTLAIIFPDLFGDLEFSVQSAVIVVARSMDLLVKGVEIAATTIIITFERLPKALQETGIEILNGFLNAVEAFTDPIMAVMTTTVRTVLTVQNQLRRGFEENAKAFALVISGQFDAAADAANRSVDAFKTAFESITGIGDTFKEELEKASTERLLPEIENTAKGGRSAFVEEFRIAFEEIAAGLGPFEENVVDIFERAGARARERLQKPFAEFIDETKATSEDAKETFSDTSKFISKAMTRAFSKSSDELVDFIVTGKGSFKDFANSVLEDLQRVLAKQLVLAGVQQLLGAFGLPTQTFGASGFKFGGGRQEGGPVDPNRTFLVGERGPELFRPNVPGQIVPADRAAALAPASATNVQVINVTDPSEIPAAMEGPEGEQVILNIIRRHRRTISQELV